MGNKELTCTITLKTVIDAMGNKELTCTITLKTVIDAMGNALLILIATQFCKLI
jgi:hypothetical protein